jgi:glycerol-3-phosphate acyltransferase PlsY
MIPIGMLVARFWGGKDITSEGSGNVGATNVARTLGKKAGVTTLAGDIAKGYLGVVLASFLSSSASIVTLSAVLVVYGHCYPIPLKLHGKMLKGGKGVATGLGAMLAIDPLTALISIVIFAVVLKLSKIVSIASLTAAISAPIVNMLVSDNSEATNALFIISVIIAIRHRENIERLVKGEEKPFNLPAS